MSTDYYENVKECAEKKINRLISNGQPQHAAYLMTEMFRNANESIRLFTGNLTDCAQATPVYSSKQLLEEAQSFLVDRQGALKILVQNPGEDFESREFIIMLEQAKSDGKCVGNINVEIRKATGEAANIENHFVAMDDHAYRIETDHDNTKAVANFNDPEFTRKLHEVFDTLFDSGEKIKINFPA